MRSPPNYLVAPDELRLISRYYAMSSMGEAER